MGPDLGSSPFASSTTLFLCVKSCQEYFFQVGADAFFKAAILYPRLQWIKKHMSHLAQLHWTAVEEIFYMKIVTDDIVFFHSQCKEN